MPNSNRQNNSGSGIKSVATFGLGALVGALAAGAMYFLSSEEEERPPQHRPQNQYYQSNHPAAQPFGGPLDNSTEKDDEKDGTIKMCEICFVSFAELKECGVQIVTTPCGHIFCKDCIVGALTVKPECPNCRTVIREQELTRLYM